MKLPQPERALDRFGVLLAVVVLAIVVLATVDTSESFPRAALANAVSGAALLVAAWTAGVSARARRAAVLLVLGVVVGNGVYAVLNYTRQTDVGAVGNLVNAGWAIAALLVPIVVVRRLLQHEQVGLATVFGAVAAYLEIAVAFAIGVQALDLISADAVFGSEVPSTSYMYVSLITISTTGYGDFVPVTTAARLMLSSEAVVGQVFLVTFVAIVVTRFSSTASSRRAEPPLQ